MVSQQRLVLESSAAPLELLKFYREPRLRLAVQRTVQCCACHTCGCAPGQAGQGLEQPSLVKGGPAHG